MEAADGNRAIVVVDALDRINLNKVARALHTDEARLLEERELAGFAPGVALGAIPAVGDLFGVRVYADYAIYEAPFYKIQVGNFETEEKAKELKKTLADMGYDVSVVPSKIRKSR